MLTSAILAVLFLSYVSLEMKMHFGTPFVIDITKG